MNPQDPNSTNDADVTALQNLVAQQAAKTAQGDTTPPNTPEDTATEAILNKVFDRIAHVLTEDDIKQINELDKDDPTGNAVKYFLISKVPNFATIVQEELQAHKATHAQQ